MNFLIAAMFATILPIFMPQNNRSMNSQPPVQDQKPVFSFGLVADIQYCDCEPAGTRYYRSSLKKLSEAMRSFREDNPAFVINLGDLIDKDFSSFTAVNKIFDSSGYKIYNITGNHDYAVDPKLIKRIPPLVRNKNGYYSFIWDKYRFIMLNGNELSTYAATNKAGEREAAAYILKLKNSGEKNAIEWNGGIGAKQILWLTDQLNTAVRNGEKVFIACHFPVYPENVHNLLNYKDILALLERYDNIIAWFSGHNHAGNYGNFNMIHFVTVKGMVETDKDNSFAVVEVYKNKIWIKGYGREKSQILAY